MKKQLFLFAAALSLAGAAMAQGGNFTRRTPEERLKPVHEKIDSAFKLDAAKMVQADTIFLQYYREQDKKMDELREAQADRGATMAARQKMADERDVKLKTVFTEAQFKIWKDEIEPSMRGPRGGGGGRPGGGK